MEYEEKIRDIIAETISIPLESIDINDELQSKGMDSIAFIEVVVKIENEFGIEFPDDKLIITESDSIEKLCDIVKEVISAQA